MAQLAAAAPFNDEPVATLSPFPTRPGLVVDILASSLLSPYPSSALVKKPSPLRRFDRLFVGFVLCAAFFGWEGSGVLMMFFAGVAVSFFF